MLKGLAASSGIGVGRAVVIQPEDMTIKMCTVSDQYKEQQRFLNAVGAFCAESLKTYYYARDHVGEKEASIITAQIVIITDPDLHKKVIAYIRQNKYNAEYAFSLVCDQYIDIFNNMEDALMRARAADFQDIKDRLLRILMQKSKRDIRSIPSGSVVVARDLSPSQAIMLNPHKVNGIILQVGSVHSHVAIIARSLRIPVVMCVPDLLSSVKDGDRLLVDGDAGQIVKNPQAGKTKEHLHHEPKYAELPVQSWPIIVSATNHTVS